jgi:hypothetical protein
LLFRRLFAVPGEGSSFSGPSWLGQPRSATTHDFVILDYFNLNLGVGHQSRIQPSLPVQHRLPALPRSWSGPCALGVRSPARLCMLFRRGASQGRGTAVKATTLLPMTAQFGRRSSRDAAGGRTRSVTDRPDAGLRVDAGLTVDEAAALELPRARRNDF